MMIIRKKDIDSTVDIVHKNNNYNRVIQLNDLFTVLPYEVLCSIFSHLSWGDLVLCMSIHPTWASYIPLYAKNKLSTFEFQTDTLQFQQCRMGLGPHVENVIMHQLIDANCVNKALEILLEQKCYNIKKLKLSECRISHLEKFISLLRQLDRHETLTELTFELHRDQIPYRHIASACPNLTHFACDLEDITYEPRLQHQQQSLSKTTANIPNINHFIPMTTTTHITYLSVNILLQRDNRLYPLLEMCPQLHCLVLGYGFFVHDGDPDRWLKPLDLNMVLQICPRIAYFQCNSWENNPAWIMHAKKNQQQMGGLREFITDHVGMYDSQQIMPLLIQHRKTLQVIKLGSIRQQRQRMNNGVEESWLHSVEQEMGENGVYFDQLHTLVLKNIEIGEEDLMAKFIRRCPNLQEISLDGWLVNTQVLNAITTTCSYLRRLELKKGPNTMATTTGVNNKSASLDASSTTTEEDPERRTLHSLVNLITHGCMVLQSIRLLGLKFINDTLLMTLFGLQKVELIDLPNISTFGMEQFTSRMKNQNQKMSIRTLVVKDMRVITGDVLIALNRSHTLHTLQLCRCGVLPDVGLLDLITNNNNRLQTLCIDCCTVSYDIGIQIRKKFGQESIRGLPDYWPE